MLFRSPRSIVITFGNKLYMILEVVPPLAISLTTEKQRSKIVSETRKFIFLTTRSHRNKNIVATTLKQGSPSWLQQMDKVMEEYKDIFSWRISMQWGPLLPKEGGMI